MTASITRAVPGYRRVQQTFLATGMGLAPLTLIVYSALSPLIRGDGTQMIAANLAADPTTNQLHLAFGVATGFLLPVGFLGLTVLTMRRAPWLATVGGILGLLGWLPWLALIGQEALTYDMAQMGGGPQLAALWDRFNADGVMSFYLLFYIVCHLLSTVLLAIALGRAKVVPVWSAWALGLTSPLTMVAFPLHNMRILYGVFVLFTLGMIPPAFAMLSGIDEP